FKNELVQFVSNFLDEALGPVSSYGRKILPPDFFVLEQSKKQWFDSQNKEQLIQTPKIEQMTEDTNDSALNNVAQQSNTNNNFKDENKPMLRSPSLNHTFIVLHIRRGDFIEYCK